MALKLIDLDTMGTTETDLDIAGAVAAPSTGSCTLTKTQSGVEDEKAMRRR